MTQQDISLSEAVAKTAAEPLAWVSNQRYMLVSVTNKKDVVWFARLIKEGWTILSTGGTAKEFTDMGFPVTLVENYTGFPEMMDGRLKTLHPKVHGGLLAVTTNPKHVESMIDHAIVPIDLLVVNLYDFSGKPGIEQIDIGGPAMIRSAAKNHERVTVVTDPADYMRVLDEILLHKATSLELRRSLAKKAFAMTARYDAMIAQWM